MEGHRAYRRKPVSQKSRSGTETTDNKPQKLVRFEHAPAYLQGNPYLRSGYRVNFTKRQCFTSIFTWNNETINIWSHLIGFFIFTGFLIHDVWVVAPKLQLSVSDNFFMIFFDLCVMFAMASSSAYHTFNCHSETFYQNFLKMDVVGVTLSSLGAYVFGIQTLLACHDSQRITYQAGTTALCVLILNRQVKTQKRTPESHRRTTAVLTSWVSLGVVVPLHFGYLAGGLQNPFVQTVLLQRLVYYLLLGGGFFFYVSKYPEKCCVGKVDYFGASHQFWHLLILGAFLWCHFCCVSYMEYRVDHGCLQEIS